MTRNDLHTALVALASDAVRLGLPVEDVLLAQAGALLETSSVLADLLVEHGFESLPTRELVDRILDEASAPPALQVVPDPE